MHTYTHYTHTHTQTHTHTLTQTQPAPGRWEIVSTSVEELEAFGNKISRSLKAADKDLANKV